MNQNNLNWIDKYKPTSLDDIYSQNIVIDILKNKNFNNNMPHILISGPPGSGKTSTIHAFLLNLYSKEYYNDNVIEINSYHERGINVIRDKIKQCAKQLNQNIKCGINWKTIILEEADSLTHDSQFALRRIMEQYSKNTRFCIICNYINKIIEPINSRCSHLIFNPVSSSDIVKKLTFIMSNEIPNYNSAIYNIINDIAINCNNDMRKAISLFEMYYIQKDLILFLDIIPKTIYERILNSIKFKNINNLIETIQYVYENNYSICNQFNNLSSFIVTLEIDDNKKHLILLKLLEIEYNLNNSADEYIQYIYFFTYLYNIYNDYL